MAHRLSLVCRPGLIVPGLLLALPLQAQTTNAVSASDAPPTATNAAPASTDFANAPIPPTLSPDPFNDPLIVQIEARHEKAVKGDRKETKALTADLERWTKDEPDNYLLLAYLGSAYTLESRDSWIGPGKLSLLKKGGQALDAAVTGDPSNPAVRFVRAINYYELPALFGKHQNANADFQVLMQQIKGVMPMPYALSNDRPNRPSVLLRRPERSSVQRPSPSKGSVAARGRRGRPKSDLGQKLQAELGKLK